MGEPYWADEDVTLYLGDCLDVLRTMEPDSIDAIVTDPPAGISFMDKEWDDFRRARNPADAGRDNVFGRTSARGPEYGRRDRSRFVDMLTARLAEAYRVLKPGGHALVWAIPRTSHWTAWAIEDAGFDLRDCVLHLFGSGFPKSLDVSKAIDKAGGNPLAFREFARAYAAAVAASSLTHADIDRHLGIKASSCFWTREDHRGGMPPRHHWSKVCDLLSLPAELERLYEAAEREVVATGHRVRRESTVQIVGLSEGDYDITAPATEAAAKWSGWGTALKPGQEMWWLARKPLKGTVAGNVLEFGTGALNVDGCRVNPGSHVPGGGGLLGGAATRHEGWRRESHLSGEATMPHDAGRWPTNIVFTHSAACEMTGTRRIQSDGDYTISPPNVGEIWDCAPDCPVGELDRQTGVLTSGANPERRRSDKFRDAYGEFAGQESCVPHRGADSGGASRFYPTFRYAAKAPASERPRLDDGTAHETVKSLDLMRWLVRLITPPGGTVADIFAGSGPTAEACIIEGFRCVLIEREPKSAQLIVKRLSKPIQPLMFGMEDSAPAAPVRRVAASKPKPVPEVHATLFDEAS